MFIKNKTSVKIWRTAVCLGLIALAIRASSADGPTGQILRDFWMEIPGTHISDLTADSNFPKSPTGSSMLASFEIPSNIADDYGTLVRGYLFPPATGKYTFWIASDDASELWLSTTDEPAKKVMIASVADYTGVHEWTKFPTQKSPPVMLTAGKKYYVEAMQKDGGGEDHMSVGWTLPDGKDERPIPGSRLAPFKAEYVKRKPFVQGEMPSNPGFHKLKYMAKVGDKTIMVPYVLYLPQDYAQNKDTYPTLLFLHGAGEGGTDLGAIFVHGPAPQLQNNEKFRNTFKFIGVFPQTTMGWDAPMSTAVLQVLDNVIANTRVDKDRVYCTGLSMGGRGTWIVAEEGAERFAGIIPMDPFAFNPDVAKAKLKNCNIWIIVGAEDGDHTTGSKQMYKTMKEVDADVYLTVVPHCGHGAWGMFYPEFTVYEWLFKHHRGKNDRIPIPQCGILGTPDKVVLAAPPNNGGQGSIRVEYYRGVGGTSIPDLLNSPDYPGDYSDSCYLTDFEIPSDQDDNYGTVMRGYVHPPANGNYTFWMASDDNGELWLSTTDNPKDKVKIASCTCSAVRAWDATPEQHSKPIALTAGKKYYIEALQKEGNGGDHLSVGWQLPDGKQERPIPAERLSPASPTPRGSSKPLPIAKLLGTMPTTPGHHNLKAELNLNGQKSEMTFVVFLPNNYDKTQEPFPMFTFLHGNTHQGNDWTGVLNEGPAKFLNDNKALHDWMPMIGFFPQCPGGQRWDNRAMIRQVVAIQDEITKAFKVDKQRIYCTGLSMGGMGTWNTALEAPDRFAAVSTISAVAVRPQQAVEKLKNVPLWIIAGGEDGGFTEGSKTMKAAFDAAGRKDVELTVVPGEGHGVWARYYNDKRFYEWLLKRRKPGGEPAAPVQVAAVPVQPPAVAAPAPVAAPPVAVAAVKPVLPPVAVAPVQATPANPAKPLVEVKPVVNAATPPPAAVAVANVPKPATPAPSAPEVKPQQTIVVAATPATDEPAVAAMEPEVQPVRRAISGHAAIEICLAGVFMGFAFFLFMTPGKAAPIRKKPTTSTYSKERRLQRAKAS